MRYKNAEEVLPRRLLEEIQRYISGESIYIPRARVRKGWGEKSGARDFYARRNEEIRERYGRGEAIFSLAEAYGLSEETIRKIVYRK